LHPPLSKKSPHIPYRQCIPLFVASTVFMLI